MRLISQESSRDHLKLLPDPKEELVQEIATQLGLRKVGWIFTDLVPMPGNTIIPQDMKS